MAYAPLITSLSPTHALNKLLVTICDQAGLSLQILSLPALSPHVESCLLVSCDLIDPQILHELSSNKGKPILLISTSTPEPSLENAAYKAGASVILSHPINNAQLLNLIASYTPFSTSQAEVNEVEVYSDLSWATAFKSFTEHSKSLSSFLKSNSPLEDYLTSMKVTLGFNRIALFRRDYTNFVSTYKAGVTAAVPEFNSQYGLGAYVTDNMRAFHLKSSLPDHVKKDLKGLGMTYCIPLSTTHAFQGFLLLGNTFFTDSPSVQLLSQLSLLGTELSTLMAWKSELDSAKADADLARAALAAANLHVITMLDDRTLTIPSGLLETLEVTSPCALSKLPVSLQSVISSKQKGECTLPSNQRLLVTPISSSRWLIKEITQDHQQKAQIRQTAIQDTYLHTFSQFSHIFNNALTDLSMASQLLTPQSLEDPEFITFLSNSLKGSSQRLARPLAQLQFWCELSNPAPLEEINLAGWIPAALSSLPNQESLVFKVPSKKLVTHTTTLRALLIELTLNALQTNTKVTVSTEETDKGVIISVQDKGTGIPPEAIDHAKTGSGLSSQSGLGLGLAIAFKCAKILNTSLQIRTQATGTEIKFLI